MLENYEELQKDIDTRTEEFDLEEMDIYPNPARDILNLRNVPLDAEITVINIEGRKVMEVNTFDKVNVSTLESGIYLLQVRSDEEVRMIKFIKE